MSRVIVLSARELMAAADRLSGAHPGMTHKELQECFAQLPTPEQMREVWAALSKSPDAVENGASSTETGADSVEKWPVRGGVPRSEVAGAARPWNAPETSLRRSRGVG